jgi:hypothetical protein
MTFKMCLTVEYPQHQNLHKDAMGIAKLIAMPQRTGNFSANGYRPRDSIISCGESATGQET